MPENPASLKYCRWCNTLEGGPEGPQKIGPVEISGRMRSGEYISDGICKTCKDKLLKSPTRPFPKNVDVISPDGRRIGWGTPICLN